MDISQLLGMMPMMQGKGMEPMGLLQMLMKQQGQGSPATPGINPGAPQPGQPPMGQPPMGGMPPMGGQMTPEMMQQLMMMMRGR